MHDQSWLERLRGDLPSWRIWTAPDGWHAEPRDSPDVGLLLTAPTARRLRDMVRAHMRRQARG